MKKTLHYEKLIKTEYIFTLKDVQAALMEIYKIPHSGRIEFDVNEESQEEAAYLLITHAEKLED